MLRRRFRDVVKFCRAVGIGPRWNFTFRGSILQDAARVSNQGSSRWRHLLAMLNTLASAGFLYDERLLAALFKIPS